MTLETSTMDLQWVLGSSPHAPKREVGVAFVGYAGSADPISVAAYHHAVDCRELAVLHRCDSPAGCVMLAAASGRHVGSLRNIVAAGRRFRTFVHAFASEGALWIYSALPTALLTDGVAFIGTQRAGTNVPFDLRDLEVDHTRWARAWALSPQVARVALLMMHCLRPADIGTRLGLAEKTVNGYIEVLFARAGVCSRGELAPAALETSGFLCEVEPWRHD